LRTLLRVGSFMAGWIVVQRPKDYLLRVEMVAVGRCSSEIISARIADDAG
jgi:hypothetical protein